MRRRPSQQLRQLGDVGGDAPGARRQTIFDASTSSMICSAVAGWAQSSLPLGCAPQHAGESAPSEFRGYSVGRCFSIGARASST